ncbi:hypothetical protein NOR_00632 [Metarhizium rileyi]|uniref:Uncharacterized protein n=1 Tax=Metarhizium rileyi (strain RCEF 4871) TaxID=1649241 RepID=A0A167KQE0_METRR|nr:hypothetical protein NOR_00632 [Metarhizium rileyi RCEF 4871]
MALSRLAVITLSCVVILLYSCACSANPIPGGSLGKPAGSVNRPSFRPNKAPKKGNKTPSTIKSATVKTPPPGRHNTPAAPGGSTPEHYETVVDYIDDADLKAKMETFQNRQYYRGYPNVDVLRNTGKFTQVELQKLHGAFDKLEKAIRPGKKPASNEHYETVVDYIEDADLKAKMETFQNRMYYRGYPGVSILGKTGKFTQSELQVVQEAFNELEKAIRPGKTPAPGNGKTPAPGRGNTPAPGRGNTPASNGKQ